MVTDGLCGVRLVVMPTIATSGLNVKTLGVVGSVIGDCHTAHAQCQSSQLVCEGSLVKEGSQNGRRCVGAGMVLATSNSSRTAATSNPVNDGSAYAPVGRDGSPASRSGWSGDVLRLKSTSAIPTWSPALWLSRRYCTAMSALARAQAW